MTFDEWPARSCDEAEPEQCDECESTGYNCPLHEGWAEEAERALDARYER